MARLFPMLLAGLAMGGRAVAQDSALCRPGLDWSAATHVRTSHVETRTSISLRRHSNGVRIDIYGPGPAKSLIMLDTGEQLFRGAASGLKDFTSVDLAAGAPIHVLREIFSTPCDAALAKEFGVKHDASDLSKGGAGVIGGKIRANKQSLEYEMVFRSAVGQGGDRTIRGTWSVAPLVPVPLDTVITGWTLQRRADVPSEVVTLKSIGELPGGHGAHRRRDER